MWQNQSRLEVVVDGKVDYVNNGMGPARTGRSDGCGTHWEAGG